MSFESRRSWVRTGERVVESLYRSVFVWEVQKKWSYCQLLWVVRLYVSYCDLWKKAEKALLHNCFRRLAPSKVVFSEVSFVLILIVGKEPGVSTMVDGTRTSQLADSVCTNLIAGHDITDLKKGTMPIQRLTKHRWRNAPTADYVIIVMTNGHPDNIDAWYRNSTSFMG